MDALHRLDEARAAKDGPFLLLIDGRSGAGKSTLAEHIRDLWGTHEHVQLIGLDSIYPGWDGLGEGVALAMGEIVEPYVQGRTSRWRRYDWVHGTRAEEHEVVPDQTLIVEGAGILTPRSAAAADASVWLEVPDSTRRRRALARDGETYRPHWERWARQEEAHIAEHDPRSLASVVLREL